MGVRAAWTWLWTETYVPMPPPPRPDVRQRDQQQEIDDEALLAKARDEASSNGEGYE